MLPVSQRIPAGVVGEPLAAGTAARIFTGAQVPAGADAIVMQEHCEALDGAVRINTVPAPGQWIRRRGEDVRAGAVVLPAGSALTPQAQGLAASVGAAELHVMRRAARGAVFDRRRARDAGRNAARANAARRDLQLEPLHAARAAAARSAARCTDLGIVPDRLDATRSALRKAAAGTRPDRHLAAACRWARRTICGPRCRPKGQLDLWQVAIKPGKPLAFGSMRGAGGRATLFMGLPGNPVSSFVTFVLAVRPVLLRLQGASTVAPRALRAARRFRLAASPTGGASSCARASTTPAASISFRTRARAC